MAKVERFDDLKVWQAARVVTADVYALTRKKPFARDFGLRDQIQRTAVSVMSNIGEGFESRTRGVFINLLGRAKGSAGDVRCQLYVAPVLEYIEKNQFDEILSKAEAISCQLHGFMKYLETLPNDSQIREDNVPCDR